MSEIIIANSLPVNVSRRSFMKQILALGVAPAIVHVANLMPVRQVVAATELDFQRVAAIKSLLPEIWSTELIEKFYRQAYLMDREKRDVMEQDLFRAMKEGRIKQSGYDNYYDRRWGYTAAELGIEP